MSDLLLWLQGLDNQIFTAINHGMTHIGFDLLFVNITDLHKVPVVKYLVIPAILALIIWRRKTAGVFIAFGLLLSSSLSDFLGGKLFKPFFERPRPPLNPDIDVIMRAPHFGGFSFPSNHASNIFCCAVFLAFFFPKLRWPLYIYAALICLSRVYVGVHYPSDVIGGALIGSLIGYLIARLTKWGIAKYQRGKTNV